MSREAFVLGQGWYDKANQFSEDRKQRRSRFSIFNSEEQKSNDKVLRQIQLAFDLPTVKRYLTALRIMGDSSMGASDIINGQKTFFKSLALELGMNQRDIDQLVESQRSSKYKGRTR